MPAKKTKKLEKLTADYVGGLALREFMTRDGRAASGLMPLTDEEMALHVEVEKIKDEYISQHGPLKVRAENWPSEVWEKIRAI